MAQNFGWRPGARYTNLRDVRDVDFRSRGFLDIHWKKYSFEQHLAAVEKVRPHLTVARDIIDLNSLEQVLGEAELLQRFAEHVVIVPKDARLSNALESTIPKGYILGYSCPTRYGSTCIPPEKFERPVHLLGGRPDVQRSLAERMPVYSFDCNRFTLDAAYGDFFDGSRFRPFSGNDYETCLKLSFKFINEIWETYGRITV